MVLPKRPGPTACPSACCENRAATGRRFVAPRTTRRLGERSALAGVRLVREAQREAGRPLRRREQRIDDARQRTASERRDPKEPELRERPVADEQSGPGAAGGVHRNVRDRNADEMDEREAEPDGNRREPGGSARVRRAENDHQEHEREHELRDERGAQAVAAGRMLAVAVRREAAAHVEARLAARDEEEHRGGEHRTHDLRGDVRRQLPHRKPFCHGEPEAHRGVQVTTGDVANRVRHREDRESECDRNPVQSDSDVRKRGGENGAAASAEHEPKCPEQLCHCALTNRHHRTSSVARSVARIRVERSRTRVLGSKKSRDSRENSAADRSRSGPRRMQRRRRDPRHARSHAASRTVRPTHGGARLARRQTTSLRPDAADSANFRWISRSRVPLR